jgi:hypothetical protein
MNDFFPEAVRFEYRKVQRLLWVRILFVFFWRSAEHQVFSASADWTMSRTIHKDTEQSTIDASVTLDGVTLTHRSGDHRMNDLQFAGRYQCLPIRCSGRLISLRNEHSIQWNMLFSTCFRELNGSNPVRYKYRPELFRGFPVSLHWMTGQYLEEG